MLLEISVKTKDFDKQLYYANKLLTIKDNMLTNYWFYEIYLNQKRYAKAIISLSKTIELKKSNNANLYSYNCCDNGISPNENEIIDLTSIYIQRGGLFELLKDNSSACEDYNTALQLVDGGSESHFEIRKKIETLITENCK